MTILKDYIPTTFLSFISLDLVVPLQGSLKICHCRTPITVQSKPWSREVVKKIPDTYNCIFDGLIQRIEFRLSQS